MKRTVFLLLLMLSAFSYTEAKTYFMVLSANGAEVNNFKLSFGDVLSDGDKIKVGKNGSINLMCASMASFQLSSGTHQLNASMCTNARVNSDLKIYRAIFDKLVLGKEHTAGEPKSVSASVARGNLFGIFAGLDSMYYCDGQFPVALNINSGKPLSVNIFEGRSPDFEVKDITQSLLKFDELFGPNTTSEIRFNYWSVSEKAGKSSRKMAVFIVPAAYRDSVVKTIYAAIGTYTSDPATQCYYTAVALEAEKYFAEALRFYQKAAGQRPEYRKQLNEFNKKYLGSEGSY